MEDQLNGLDQGKFLEFRAEAQRIITQNLELLQSYTLETKVTIKGPGKIEFIGNVGQLKSILVQYEDELGAAINIRDIDYGFPLCELKSQNGSNDEEPWTIVVQNEQPQESGMSDLIDESIEWIEIKIKRNEIDIIKLNDLIREVEKQGESAANQKKIDKFLKDIEAKNVEIIELRKQLSSKQG